MKFKKVIIKAISTTISLFVFIPFVQSQCTPLANAVPGLSLPYNMGVNNATGVACNPNLALWYTAQAGNPGFPLHTFDVAGTPLYQTNTGFDMRGLWWNVNANQLESNGYNAGGIWAYNLNGLGYALNTGVSIFGGNNQPTSQSVGDYNRVDNEIWYYNAGTIMKRNRANNALIGIFAITGLPVGTGNLNNNTVFYTDCPGYEIGLLDYILKRIYFVDKSTMAYTGMSQLPAGTVTSNAFKSSWGGGLVWLLNSGVNIWYSFSVLSNMGAPCTLVLPVELLSFDANNTDNGEVLLSWTTSSETNNDYFTVERSTDGESFSEIAEVPGAGNSSVDLNYETIDHNPAEGINYYRLKQTDLNGKFEHSETIAIEYWKDSEIIISNVYPNPAKETINIKGNFASPATFELYDLTGRKVLMQSINSNRQINISPLAKGLYVWSIGTARGKVIVE